MVRDEATSSKFPLSPDLAYAVHCQAKVLGILTQSLNLIEQSLTSMSQDEPLTQILTCLFFLISQKTFISWALESQVQWTATAQGQLQRNFEC